MKKLIEESIKVLGIGHPDTITVFNIQSEEDRNHPMFKNLELFKNRKLSILFDYEEDDKLVKQQHIRIIVPNEIEENIKIHIINKINSSL